ncbi:MAG TPA: Rieske 2Fe-2S domain-containing protein [Conexibacter sp.]|nr:Rieske 2Fe-2S domain-containing protein [Conexibacter sp.]
MQPTVPFDALEPGSCVIHRIGAAKVLIARIGDAVHATTAICTHARVELAVGRLTPDCLVECPMHGALFSPVDGAVHEGPAIDALKIYDTRIVDGIVHVDVGEDAQATPSQPSSSTPGARPSLASWGRTAR